MDNRFTMSEAEQRKKKQKLWPVAARPKANGRDVRNAPFSMPQLAQWHVQDGHCEQLIQIETSVLHPQLNYKTVLISRLVTVRQVVEMMVERHALRPQDKNPQDFLLTECVESLRGSYTRVLDDDELVLDIQDRWQDNEGYFKLCRRPSEQEEDEKRKRGMLFEENALGDELTATVLPPSESSEDLQFSPARPWREGRQRRLSLPSDSSARELAELQQTFCDRIGDGMSDMMTRVVQEGEQLRTRKGTWSGGSVSTHSPQRHKPWGVDRSNVSPKRDKPPPLKFTSTPPHRSPLLTSRQKKEVIRIQPLFYSPSMSARREFPQFVFNPSMIDDKEKDGIVQAESPVSHDFMVVDSTIVPKSFSPAFNSNKPVASATITQPQRTRLLVSNTSSTSDPDSAFISERRFSYSTETEHSTFDSDMNLLDSLSSILEAKFSSLGGRTLEESVLEPRPPAEQPSECGTKPTQPPERVELISPRRRSRLVEEACNMFRRQRSQSCPAFPKSAHPRGKGSAMNQRCVSTSPLISPTRKNKLIENASKLVRKQESERLILAAKTSPLITHRLLYTSPQVSPTLVGTSDKGSCESFVQSVDTSTRTSQIAESEEEFGKSLPSTKSKQAEPQSSAGVQGKIKSVSKLFSFSRRGNKGRERARASTEGTQSISPSKNLAKYRMTRSASDHAIQASADGENNSITGQ